MNAGRAADAADPRSTAWVSANAGAGKTYMLTNRVTRLLVEGANPSRILCLTYTKAAAAEMAARLFNRLGEWALFSDEKLTQALKEIGADSLDAKTLRRARRLFAEALETPGGLKIQTIHAFCQHVLTRFPVEAGVAPRFSVLDERSAGELMARARNEILERSGHDARLRDAVSLLATRTSDGRFADILDAALARAGKLRALLEHHASDEARLFAHLRKTLDVAPDDTEETVLARFCAELGGERASCERTARWLLGGSSKDKVGGEKLSAFLAEGDEAARFAALYSLFFTKNGEPRKNLATKATAAAGAGHLEYLDSVGRRAQAAEEKRKGASVAALTEALVTTALAVLAAYDRLKAARAALDYGDLIARTLELLEARSASAWVLYKLDGGIDHVLVDEAQDTSPEQWRIVAKLTEDFFSGAGARGALTPRTLFAVGDEKQSIFSFQGADPEAFGRQRVRFKALAEGAGLAFADLRPAVSRRSGLAVLDFVDSVFAGEGAREGLTSSDDAIRHDPHRDAPARVELWPPVKTPEQPKPHPWDLPVDAPKPHSASALLAQRIAARIAGWLAEGTCIPGTARAVRPGDIMILVRRRNAFTEEMIRQLLERHVPVAGADRMVLMDQIAIADLVALGRFALLPEDDLTLAAVLKSPLVDLSEDGLFALAHKRTASLWSALRERRRENVGFARAYDFLAGMRRHADFLPPFEFYARALTQGGRRRLIARLGAEAADAIDEFQALALAHESAHPPSLESFLDWFEKGASEVKRDMEQGGGAVRVMTVHGAKGLEADIVIVPDSAQVPDHGRRSGLLYTEDCVFYGVPQALETAAVAAAKADAQRQEMREYRRLLYVALTRAREWLILDGYEQRSRIDPASWYAHVAAVEKTKAREETIGGETVLVWGAGLERAATGFTPAAAAGTALPVFLSTPAAAEAESPRILRPSDALGDEPALISPLADTGTRFRRGLLVHALLARLPDLPPAQRAAAAMSYLARQGLDAETAAALAAETLAVLGHPDFAALFAPGSRAEIAVAAELPELGAGARVNGQIDRLAVTRDTVLVADFKTNRPPPADAAHTPRLYLTQMALYRAALAKIYPGRRIVCVLVWTDGTRLMELPAAALEAEFTRLAAQIAAGQTTQDLP